MFKYWGFGLHIASEIAFPELLPALSGETDITIAYGKTPQRLEGAEVKKRPFSSIGKDEYLLNIKNVCKYYVSHGTSIIVEPTEGIDENSIRLFLLGTVMAAAIYQRGSIPLHASAIVKDGQLIIFAGHSGAGKSTLIAHLASRGYEIFTDDICVMHHVMPGQKGVYCTASYPMIKLWADTITELDNGQFTRDFKIRPELPKYGQFFYDKFNTSSLPIGKIFILAPNGAADHIKVKKLEAIQAFKQLEMQAYKHQLITSTKLRGVHFTLLSELINSVDVYEVARPTGGTTVEQLGSIIEKMF